METTARPNVLERAFAFLAVGTPVRFPSATPPGYPKAIGACQVRPARLHTRFVQHKDSMGRRSRPASYGAVVVDSIVARNRCTPPARVPSRTRPTCDTTKRR